MNPKLKLARETMKRLRSRRCVQRSVVLRLTIADAAQLKEILAALQRDYDDTEANRNGLLLANHVYCTLRDAIEKEKQHNS